MAGSSGDKRYKTRRWQAVRLAVLHRDLWTCWVPGCPADANVADHRVPVDEYTTDAEFFHPQGLRASCRIHNIARGFAAGLERDLAGEAPKGRNPLVSRHSFGSRPKVLG